jgi:hypothetical protein
MIIKIKLTPVSLLAIAVIFFSILSLNFASSSTTSNISSNTVKTAYVCGVGKTTVPTSIDFGCKGTSCQGKAGSKNCPSISPITDILFAIIRFLSVGVGLIVVASFVYAGIQYVGSRGEPQATEHAVTRIRSNVIAVIVYIFAYAILNYIIPPGYLL